MSTKPSPFLLLRKLAVLLTAAIGLTGAACLCFNYQGYVRFLELHFARDAHISSSGKITLLLYIAIGVLLAALALVDARTIRFMRFDLRLKALAGFLLLLAVSWLFRGRFKTLYVEDGVMETATTLFLFGALVATVGSLRRSKRCCIRWAYLTLSLLMLFVVGEEISWGQRLIGWGTPDSWKAVNYQQETNLHNLFNPLLTFIYCAGCLILGVLGIKGRRLLIRALWPRKRLLVLRHLFPHGHSEFLGVVCLGLSVGNILPLHINELTEEILYAATLSYSLYLYANPPEKRVIVFAPELDRLWPIEIRRCQSSGASRPERS
jgi:hypothetical protein